MNIKYSWHPLMFSYGPEWVYALVAGERGEYSAVQWGHMQGAGWLQLYAAISTMDQ